METYLTSNTLYEQDYFLWLEITLKQLRQQDLEHLDWQHLIEEIEALGRAEKHKVESYLWQLLIHLLLYRYWQQEKEYCAAGWEDEITVFRFQLHQLISSKTLYNYFLTILEPTYLQARKRAIRKTQLPSSTFPLECPFTLEQILDSDYLPE